MKRFLMAVFLGVLFGAGIYALQLIAEPRAGHLWALQDSIFHGFCITLQPVAPGFFAGWVAGRRGFTIGVLVGIGLAIVSPLVAYPIEGFFWPMRVILINGAVTAILGAITQCVGGIAGEALRQKRVVAL